MPDDRYGDRRERLVEATLDLCTGRWYEAITVDQIADAAHIPLSDFAGHFATKDAVVMSIVDDLLNAIAEALGDVKKDIDPEHALLAATVEVIGAIIDGRGVITRDRMLAMGRIVTARPYLRKQVSAARKRVLTRALADRMGLDSQDRRVQRAVTLWSAVAAGAYVDRLGMAPGYDSRDDDRLSERVAANLSQIFADVMGPARPQCNRN
jgi:AcrR family transcriptional regulator